MTKFDFSVLLSKACSLTMTPTNITNGFQKCGVYPFDPAAVKPSTTSPGVVEHSNDEEIESGDEEEDKTSGQNQQESIAFTAEEEALFSRRFDEGFDILIQGIMIGWELIIQSQILIITCIQIWIHKRSRPEI